jgi:hypothetical protein
MSGNEANNEYESNNDINAETASDKALLAFSQLRKAGLNNLRAKANYNAARLAADAAAKKEIEKYENSKNGGRRSKRKSHRRKSHKRKSHKRKTHRR